MLFSFESIAGGSADDEGFDRLEYGLHIGGFAEGTVGGDREAQQRVQGRRVASLDAVDGEGRREHFRVFDVPCLAEVRGRTEVLDRAREFGNRFRVFEREFGFRFRRGLAAEFLHRAGQRFDVLLLLGAELLQHREFFTLEEPTLADFLVERRLQVLEGEGVVEDADVTFSELFGFGFLTVAGRFGWGGHRRRAAPAAATGGEDRSHRRATSDRDELASRYRVHDASSGYVAFFPLRRLVTVRITGGQK